jgi:hypothetical protein
MTNAKSTADISPDASDVKSATSSMSTEPTPEKGSILCSVTMPSGPNQTATFNVFAKVGGLRYFVACSNA